MRKILFTALVGERLNHEGYSQLLERNSVRLKEYCDKWGFELRVIRCKSAPEGAGRISGHPVWIKFGYYNRFLKNDMADGDKVVWCDVDTILIRKDFDLTPQKDFSISREPSGRVSAGIMGWTKGDFSQRLIDWVWNAKDEDMLLGFPRGWIDQPTIFSFLASLTDSERQQHVQIWPNYVNGSGGCEDMTPDTYQNMVFRHFGGGREIEWGWFNHPLRDGPSPYKPL